MTSRSCEVKTKMQVQVQRGFYRQNRLRAVRSCFLSEKLQKYSAPPLQIMFLSKANKFIRQSRLDTAAFSSPGSPLQSDNNRTNLQHRAGLSTISDCSNLVTYIRRLLIVQHRIYYFILVVHVRSLARRDGDSGPRSRITVPLHPQTER